MIGKIFPKSSGSFSNRIKYIFGLSKHDHEITDILTIDSNCLTPDPLPNIQINNLDTLTQLIQEFDLVENLRKETLDSEKLIKPVFHAMLSLRPSETLNQQQWQEATRDYIKALGFNETTKYVAVMHKDTDHEHVHIVANRIKFTEDFTLVSDSHERTKSLNAVDLIENKFNLSKAPKPTETWGVAISHAEAESAKKTGQIPFKHLLIAKIAGAIEATVEDQGDMIDFVKHLRKEDVYIHLALKEDGQPRGISYEHKGKTISGRQLKRSRLTFQKLTTQEGIHYDPTTISELQREASIRKTSSKGKDRERARDDQRQRRSREYWYFWFEYNRKKRVGVKIRKGSYRDQKEAEEALKAIIEMIVALLLALFGVSFTARPARPDPTFYEYDSKKQFKPKLSEHEPHP